MGSEIGVADGPRPAFLSWGSSRAIGPSGHRERNSGVGNQRRRAATEKELVKVYIFLRKKKRKKKR